MSEAGLASVLGQFAATYGCMLVMPGPNTFVVLRSTSGRTVAGPLLAAAGIAIGATAAAMMAACAAAALPQCSVLRTIGSLVVAALLIRMAVGLAADVRPGGAPPEPKHRMRIEPFAVGFGAALLNPVSIPYFASFFLSHAATRLVTGLICGAVFAMAGTWFASLGLVATRMNRIALPPLYRRFGRVAVVGCLVAMAARHLWLAAMPV